MVMRQTSGVGASGGFKAASDMRSSCRDTRGEGRGARGEKYRSLTPRPSPLTAHPPSRFGDFALTHRVESMAIFADERRQFNPFVAAPGAIGASGLCLKAL